MDVLDDILATLDLKGALYFRTDFSPPWSVAVPELEQAARFHLVIQGHCQVGVDSGVSVSLNPGDLILIPRGRPHVLSDQPAREAAPLERVLRDSGFDGHGVLVLGEGQPEASTQLVCGHLSFRKAADHPLLRALPDYLHITAPTRAREPWLDDLLRMIPRRLLAGQMGSEAAATRLSEMVFIELIRVGIQDNESMASILQAFADRYVGRSLHLIHTQPEQPWTVATLARAIGMSRSRFAARFGELMGTGPMAYLADWRLQKALALLDETREPVQQVAYQTGYQSPAAFTRAFAGKFGVSPSAYRKSA